MSEIQFDDLCDARLPQILSRAIERCLSDLQYLQVIDIGCGDGLQISLLREYNCFKYFLGFDVIDKANFEFRNCWDSVTCLNKTSSFREMNYEVWDIRNSPPFQLPKADLIILSNVLHFLSPSRAREVLEIAKSVLKPSGLLYISVIASTRSSEVEFEIEDKFQWVGSKDLLTHQMAGLSVLDLVENENTVQCIAVKGMV